VETFSCLLVDAAVTLERVQAMSSRRELAIAILGALRPYIGSIERMRSRRDGDRSLCCASAVFFRRHKPTIIALLLPPDVEDPGIEVVIGVCEGCAQRGRAAAGLEGRSPGKDDAGAAKGPARLPIRYADLWSGGRA